MMDGDGWRRLGCAILLRAWRDCHNRNGHKAAQEAGIPEAIGLAGDARQFLESEGAAWLLGLLEFDGGTVDAIRAELPAAEWVQLALGLEV